MRGAYYSISAIFFAVAIFFGWLANVLTNADGMTAEEYARQARCIAFEQTVSACDSEMKEDRL